MFRILKMHDRRKVTREYRSFFTFRRYFYVLCFPGDVHRDQRDFMHTMTRTKMDHMQTTTRTKMAKELKHSWKSHSWSNTDTLEKESTCDNASWMSQSWSTVTDTARDSINGDRTAAQDSFRRCAPAHATVPAALPCTLEKQFHAVACDAACTNDVDSGLKTKCPGLAMMNLPKHHSRGASRQGKEFPKSLSSLDFELAVWKRCMGGKHHPSLMFPGLVRVRRLDSNPAISSDVAAKSRQHMIRSRHSEPDLGRASLDRTSKKAQRMFSSNSLSNVTENTDNKDPHKKNTALAAMQRMQHAGCDSPKPGPSTKQSESGCVGIEFISIVLWPLAAVLAVLNQAMMGFSYRFQLSSTSTRTGRRPRESAMREVYEAARDMQLQRDQVQAALAAFRRAEERYVRANRSLEEWEASRQV